MKRLPVIVSFLAVVALSASLAYWGLQLFKPPQRPIAAVQVQAAPEPRTDAARGLFGGEVAVAAISNYQLRGVVAAGNGRRSVAIIVADGQPAKAYPVGAEVAAGVTVKEVQPRFVMLSEGGVPKRLDLAADVKGSDSGIAPPLPMPQAPPPPPAQPVQTPSMQPGGATMPAPVSGAAER